MLKRVIAYILAAILLMQAVPVFAEETDGNTDTQETGVLLPEEQTAVPTEETDGDVDAQETGTLMLDDENIYEGMERAYKDGYTPTIENDTAIVVLPLYSERNMGKLTVTPNIVDGTSSPFVLQNYQKSFELTEMPISGTEETKRIYYIRFDFPLSKTRMNGTYSITFNIQGNGIAQSYTSYVTISDGKDPNADSPPVSVSKPQSQPILLVSGYTITPEIPKAGESFEIEFELKNTSEKKSVRNMTVTVSTDSPSIFLTEKSDTVYISKFAKGETQKIKLHFKSELSTAPGKYRITLNMRYDNSDAMTLSSAGTVQVDILQPMRVELTVPQIPEEVNAGDTMNLMFQVLNLGRGKIYNARCELSVPGLIPSGTAFIGNMEAGSSASEDINVFIGTMNMSPEYEGEEKYGFTTGEVVLIFEDEYGKEYRQSYEISTYIEEPAVEAVIIDEEAEKKEEQRESQWWIFVLAAGTVIISALICIIITKRNRKYETKND